MRIDCLPESEVESWSETRPLSAESLILAAPPMRLHLAGGGVGGGSSSPPMGDGHGSGGSSSPPVGGCVGGGADSSSPPVGGAGVGSSSPPGALPAPSLCAWAHV